MTTTPPLTSPVEKSDDRYVGHHVRRLDGREKLNGSVTYTDDLPFEGQYIVVVRSTVPHGEIRHIDTDPALEIPGITAIITGEDLERATQLDPFMGPAYRDQPILAIDKVRYVGEPVAAVVGETMELARRGANRVSVRYDRLPTVETMAQAQSDTSPPLHDPDAVAAASPELEQRYRENPPNVAFRYQFESGEVDHGYADADHVVTGTYSTPMVQHVHLEPFVAIARYNHSTDSIHITTGNQTPFYLRKDIARIFDLPTSRVEINISQIGGSFGAKTYTRVESIAAIASWIVGEPVKIRLTGIESFETTVRDATEITIETGVTADGKIVAQGIEINWDTGAYADVGPGKVKKATYTAPSAYDIDNVRVTSTCIYTNKPPAVPYRGFGVAQTAWAVESHMDVIASTVGLDPYEVRLRNVIQDNDTFNGQPVGVTGASACLTAAADESNWIDAEVEQPSDPELVRGRGMAITIKATKSPSTAEAIALLERDGSLSLLVGSTEFGQGVHTTLAQIAADCLGIDLSEISVSDPNTASVPFNTSTTASRSTFAMGNAVLDAVNDTKSQLYDIAASKWGCDPDTVTVSNGMVSAGSITGTVSEIMDHRFADGGTLIGRGYYTSEDPLPHPHESAFWITAATVADVVVDTRTGKWTVERWINVADAGQAIDPKRVRGQLVGGAVQGLGHVMSEQLVFEAGQQTNMSLVDYKVPTINDVPEPENSRTVIVESHDPTGPVGAKGVGETTTITVPPAIGNAIADALGTRITSVPITPERVVRALEETHE